MKVTLNLYQPNFKAIELNDDEKRQISSTLHTLKSSGLSDFQKNILKSDIMDVFIPHIEKEAEIQDDPKSAKFDLNMKMFDALNSFADKKNPLGWFLSVLNGTEYKEPKLTIDELLDEESNILKTEEDIRVAEAVRKAKEAFYQPKIEPKKNKTSIFNYNLENERIYSRHEIKSRARKLHEYFGNQYKFREILSIVEQNKYLVEHSNNDVDNYITNFAEELDFEKEAVKAEIAVHPLLLRQDTEHFQKQINKLSQITCCRKEVCKNVLLRKPSLLDENLDERKESISALRFYKLVRGKADTQDISTLAAPYPSVSHLKTLTFLIAAADRKRFNMAKCTKENLIQYLSAQDGKTYKFTVPDCDDLTDDFIDYAINLSVTKLGKNIFDFNVVSREEYSKILKPSSFVRFTE